MKPGQAVMVLTRQGFRFRLDGDGVKVKFEGQDKPNPDRVASLLDLVRQHKDEVRQFLRCYCPNCGGVVFVGDECFLCDWLPQVRQQTMEPEKGEKMNICGECGHFLPSRLNPPQGFGRCALERLSKRPGAYPGRTACLHFEGVVGDDTLRLAQ